MGWLRSVGSIKLQVSFAEYRFFYRALLQQRPIILSILLTIASPYIFIYVCMHKCTHTHTHANIHTHAHAHMHTHTNRCVISNVKYMGGCLLPPQLYIHYIYIHTHSRSRTHTQTRRYVTCKVKCVGLSAAAKHT